MRSEQLEMMSNAMERENEMYVATISVRRTLESRYEQDRTTIFAKDIPEAQAKLRKHLLNLFAEQEDIWYVHGQLESEPMQTFRRCEVDYLTRPFETMNESVYGMTLLLETLERKLPYEDVVLYRDRYWPTENLIRYIEREREYQANSYLQRHVGDAWELGATDQ